MAGRKGGQSSHARRRNNRMGEPQPAPPAPGEGRFAEQPAPVGPEENSPPQNEYVPPMEEAPQWRENTVGAV
jgi:hypothetical protein